MVKRILNLDETILSLRETILNQDEILQFFLGSPYPTSDPAWWWYGRAPETRQICPLRGDARKTMGRCATAVWRVMTAVFCDRVYCCIFLYTVVYCAIS